MIFGAKINTFSSENGFRSKRSKKWLTRGPQKTIPKQKKKSELKTPSPEQNKKEIGN